jgi:hypothetical protein
LRDLPPLLWAKAFCPRLAALQSALTPKLDSRRISFVWLAILDLTGGNIADELRQSDRIAWAFLAFRGHAAIIAQMERWRTTDSSVPNFKVTQYLRLTLAARPHQY